MGKPLSEQTLYERLEPEFTDLSRAQSAISVAVDRIRNLNHDDPVLDIEDEIQLAIDTLITTNRSLASIAGEIEEIALDFERRAASATFGPPPSPPPGPPRLVVDNVPQEATP